MPWTIDVFENSLYWASKESQDLFVQVAFVDHCLLNIKNGSEMDEGKPL